MPFTPTLVITNPSMGYEAVFEGQAFAGTGNVVAVKVTSLQYRATSLGAGSSTGNILVAMTKTGDFTPATSFHSFPVTLDGAVHDLGTMDFSSEMSLTNAEAASGNVGVIVDWNGTFSNVKVELAQPTALIGFSVQAGQSTGSGLVYGEYSGCDEYVAIISGGMYSENGQYVDLASANHWSSNLAPLNTTLNALYWEGTQYQQRMYITEPNTGVFFRDICGLDAFGIAQIFGPLYQDYQHPGSNGDGVAQIINPPYVPHVFDHTADTITAIANTTSPAMTPTYTIDATSNKPTINIVGGSFVETGYLEFEIDTGTAINFTKTGQLMEYLMLHYVTSKTLNGSGQFEDGDNSNLGFQSNLNNYQVRFADSSGFVAGHQTAYVVAESHGTIHNSQDRDNFTFYDLNSTISTFPAIMAAVRKIRIRVGPRGANTNWLRLEEFIPLGQYYHYNFPSKQLTPSTDPSTDGPVVWAFNYTEGATSGNARLVQMTAAQALGSRYDPLVPFGGSFVSLTIPPAPAPFTSAAQICIYRQTGTSTFQRVARSVDSSDSFVFLDQLTDFEILADTTTYPVVSLDFDPLTAADSGQATNMINCCSAFGSLIFFGADGFAYGSQTNNPQVFFWPHIDPDLTGVDPSEVPRTLAIANNRGLPVLIGIFQGCLYMHTRKETYVMRSLSTFALADFPSKLAGCRGVCGTRAACAFDDGSLFGSDDGLWYVAVNPYQPTVGGDEKPSVNVEVTKGNRRLWAKLIGSATQRVKLIVQTTGQDIWCFCENRYIHIDMRRGGGLVYGEWATGKSIAAAHGDPKRGMVAVTTDGTLIVTGAYLTDGGLDVAGATGNPPSWLWRGKRFTSPKKLIAARAVWENQLSGSQPSRGSITAFTQRGSVSGDSIDFTDSGGVGKTPFDLSESPVSGDWFEIEVAGMAWDKIVRLDLHITDAQSKTIPR